MIATAPTDILRFALARIDEGVGTAIVTLAGIEGSSPRAIGAQMAVSADGRHLGSFSGGCIETAVIAEAIDTLAGGRARLVRFGAGSPYIDIRLPCGGGIDLLFNPLAGRDAIAGLLSRHARRELAALHFSMGGVRSGLPTGQAATGWQGDDFTVGYKPTLRLIALGQGEELTAVVRLAAAYGAGITAMSPDLHTLASLAAEGFDTAELGVRTRLPALDSDPWTAILFLFHDRDWEEYLLPHALNAPAFYVGAIGSQRTQRLRLGSLEAAGVSAHLRDRLRTAVGLIPATRDPATLALSALAQIVEDYQLIEHGRWPQPAAHFETVGNRRGPGASR
ncbi:XdhC family protein [Sphingopyxis sp.]|uniref:XdhC family protein n=1 Tax=Sphingopyxis sp. TaxID=1908224 RepID=UPI002ED83A8B